MKRKGLDKIFVKRYWVGFKGDNRYNELISADSPSIAIKKYMWERGIKENTNNKIIIKRWLH